MRVLWSLAVLTAAALSTATAQQPDCVAGGNGNHNGWNKQAQRDPGKQVPPGWDVRPARGCDPATPPPDSTPQDTTPPPPPPGNSVTGHVYYGFGVQANVRMDLTGAMTASTSTDATGSYAFYGLIDGTYTVCEEVPVGSKETYPTVTSFNPACPTGAGWSFTLSGTNAAFVDFQNQPM